MIQKNEIQTTKITKNSGENNSLDLYPLGETRILFNALLLFVFFVVELLFPS